MKRQRILVLCTGNSARSQMAEGLMRHLGDGKVEACSAGTHPQGLHPLAVEVMREIGIDISHQESKSLEGFLDQSFDCVITVCDRANESCPVFPGAPRRLHWSIEDPAAVTGEEKDRMEAFRKARKKLNEQIREFITFLGDSSR